MKKRSFCFLLALVFCMSAWLCGCGKSGNASDSAVINVTESETAQKNSANQRVGISMPTKKDTKWVRDAGIMKKAFEKKGYTVELAYANGKSDTQINQFNAMLADDCGVILVASVDSDAMAEALRKNDTSNTTVIAYSMLIPDCDAVDYFIGVDSYANGQMQAKYLVKKLGLEKTKKSYNLELFHQSGNGSAQYTFKGAMDVLKPYLKDSRLVIPSGDTTTEECGVADTDAATERLRNLLKSTYRSGKSLNAILCTDDSVSVGVTKGLTKNYSGSVFPLIAGCNCNPESISRLISGKLTITSVETTGDMANEAAKMAIQAVRGKKVDQSKKNPYDVPAYLYQPTEVTLKNYKEKLFDSGLYVKEKDGTIAIADTVE